MRKQFEKLPDVAEKLNEKHIVFIANKYTTANSSFYDSVNWLNGAWYAYQEQQKKIEALIQSWNEKGMRGCSDYAMGAMHSLQNCTDELSKVFDCGATVGNADVSEILHSIDNYFDQAECSKTQRVANNLIAEIYEKLSGEVKQEFQVDWSQAPEDAFEWKMVGDNEAAWVSFHAGEFYLEDAPNFNYQGAWQDSLRKRP